ncbi:MAG TPA: hypothetical protein VLG11_00940 [Candidatus Saccharimonadales bacterium]|nr:hypothetical protein [Candidatus Saccharimonadales bacterium]
MLKVWSIIRTPSELRRGLAATQAGFSVVEVLLAVVVLGFLVTGLIGAVVYGRASTASSGDNARATMLAEEGIEATKNIAAASYANLVDSGSVLGDTTVEAGSDYNVNGTSALKITTGASGGAVSSVSVYLKTLDATNQHVQAAVYADSSGTPGARLGSSAIQTGTANSWNVFPISGVTLAASTNYWISLSEDGATQFADNGSGGTSAYRVTGGYPAPNPFAADSANTADKPSIYVTLGSTYGLSKSGGQWAFSGTSDTTDIFTRQLTVVTSSANRKTITSTVTWPQPGGTTGSVTLTTELTNWKAATKTWANAIVAGSVQPTGTTANLKVFVNGNYAYVVRGGTSSNFIVVNLSTPTAPTIVSTTTFSGTPTNVFASGGYAYVTTSTASTGLEIINVSNPAAPTLTKTVSFTGTGAAKGVFVNGNYAYVVRAADATTGANEFNVVNVTTPASASVVGGYNNDIAMNEVYMTGAYAYVATSSTTQEMLVINVTTPTAPALAATYNPATTLAATTVTGYGNTVLLGMSTTLDAINITTPTTPTRLGTFTAAGTISDIETDVTGQYAFLGTSSTTGEFQVVNIGTPSAMTLAKTVDVSGTTSTVNGVDYSPTLDVTVGASNSTTQGVLVFTRN